MWTYNAFERFIYLIINLILQFSLSLFQRAEQ